MRSESSEPIRPVQSLADNCCWAWAKMASWPRRSAVGVMVGVSVGTGEGVMADLTSTSANLSAAPQKLYHLLVGIPWGIGRLDRKLIADLVARPELSLDNSCQVFSLFIAA